MSTKHLYSMWRWNLGLIENVYVIFLTYVVFKVIILYYQRINKQKIYT